MLNKIMTLLALIGLFATINPSALAQNQVVELKNSRQWQTLSKRELLNSTERATELLEKDSFAKVKKDSITAKTMQDSDKAQQKKKFVGINTTTAIAIGAAIAAAIIIVLATKGGNDRPRGPIQCVDVRAPCP
ncbi:hypothetical protein BH20ACI1_BH20ACI1_24740 [soil metagenome]